MGKPMAQTPLLMYFPISFLPGARPVQASSSSVGDWTVDSNKTHGLGVILLVLISAHVYSLLSLTKLKNASSSSSDISALIFDY